MISATCAFSCCNSLHLTSRSSNYNKNPLKLTQPTSKVRDEEVHPDVVPGFSTYSLAVALEN